MPGERRQHRPLREGAAGPVVARAVERARDRLAARLSLEALVLFGSRARGDALETSDWDLAVVSGDFEGLNPLQRGLHVVDCVLPGIEFLCLTPSELLRPEPSYVRCAVLEEGVPIVDRGPYARAKARYEAEKAAGRIRFRGPMVEFR